jgi:DNA mismatch repair protein MutL
VLVEKMSKIRVLDENTINQMAAGEVIENPSSIVKELLDNSLDSCATEIIVEIIGGGRQLIKVVDNGCGMSQDDALLSLERHATSKISSINDLSEISSKGFRGEAIPSIASISKLTLLTNENESGEGTLLIVNGGQQLQCQPVACSKGTTFEVKSLFFNVPVRKKFQRAVGYDNQQVCKVFNEIALAHPEVYFKLISDHRQVYSYPSSNSGDSMDDFSARIHDVLGGEFLSQTFSVQYEEEHLSLKGFFGLPSFTRPNRTGQYFLLNKRPIYSQSLSKSVLKAYGTHLTPRRFPVFVSYWDVSPECIDINVHPQKREVRFRRLNQWEDGVIGAIQAGLIQQGVTPPVLDFNFPDLPTFPSERRYDSSVSENNSKNFSLYDPLRSGVEYSAFSKIEDPTFFSSEESRVELKIIGMNDEYLFIDPLSVNADFWNALEVVYEGGILIVNKNAVQERVIFDHIMGHLKNEPSEIQHLLIPHPLETTLDETLLLREHLSELSKIGIEIKEDTDEKFFIHSHPASIFLEEVKKIIVESLVEELVDASFSENLAIIAGKKVSRLRKGEITYEQAQLLIKTWLKSDDWIYSPQGKSTTCYLNKSAITHLFNKEN